jgi:hypothetical protein
MELKKLDDPSFPGLGRSNGYVRAVLLVIESGLLYAIILV